MSAPFWAEVDAGVALGLGAVLAVAAVRKAQHADVFALTLQRLDRALSGRASRARRLTFLVAAYEFATAVGLNAFRRTVGFLFAGAALIACAGFLAALLRAIQQSVPCACFGRLGRTAAGGREIARAVVLLGGAGFLVVHRAIEPGTTYGFGSVAVASALAFLLVVAVAQRIGARIRPGTEMPRAGEGSSLGGALRALAGVDNELYAPRPPAHHAS
jgi:hypothetical protein